MSSEPSLTAAIFSIRSPKQARITLRFWASKSDAGPGV